MHVHNSDATKKTILENVCRAKAKRQRTSHNSQKEAEQLENLTSLEVKQQ